MIIGPFVVITACCCSGFKSLSRVSDIEYNSETLEVVSIVAYMKKLSIIANWKSYKNTQEAKEWIQTMSKFDFSNHPNKEVIVCVPFTLLAPMKKMIEDEKLPIKLGAQDISPFQEGAFTGEISGRQIKEFADYVLIGHSERRREFNESDSMLALKVQMALKYELTVIYCILNESTAVPQGVSLIAYELASAIGTGTPDTPESAEFVAHAIKQKYPSVLAALYGASVKPENTNSFTTCASIDGVLVGGASLDAQKFMQIINNS